MNPGFRDRDHRRVRNHSAFIISNVKRVKDGRGPIGPGVLGGPEISVQTIRELVARSSCWRSHKFLVGIGSCTLHWKGFTTTHMIKEW